MQSNDPTNPQPLPNNEFNPSMKTIKINSKDYPLTPVASKKFLAPCLRRFIIPKNEKGAGKYFACLRCLQNQKVGSTDDIWTSFKDRSLPLNLFKDNGSSSIIDSHFNKFHENLIQAKRKQEVVDDDDPPKKQVVRNSKDFEISSLVWCVQENIPLCMFDSPHFRQMMTNHQPGYCISSEVMKTNIGKLASFGRSKLITLWKDKDGHPYDISFTFDNLASKDQYSFTEIVAHWIDEEWVLRKCVVWSARTDSPITTIGDLKKITADVGIEWSQLTCIVTMVEPDMLDLEFLLQQSGIPYESCAVYNLQIFAQTIIDSSRYGDLLQKLRYGCTIYAESSHFTEALFDNQKSPIPLPLVSQAVDDCWLSLYSCLEAFISLKPYLISLKDQDGERNNLPLEMTMNEWETLERICCVLKLIKSAVDFLEDQMSVTVSAQPFLMNQIRTKFDTVLENPGPEINDSAKFLSSSLQFELNCGVQTVVMEGHSRGNGGYHLMGALLDPRFKKLCGIHLDLHDTIKEAVIKEVILMTKAKHPPSTPCPPPDQTPVEELDTDDVFHVFNVEGSITSTANTEFSEVPDDKALSLLARDELRRYLLSAPLIVSSMVNEKKVFTNPLRWWKDNEGLYPMLAGAAKKVLAIPASSFPVEAEFSALGMNEQLVADRILLRNSWECFNDLIPNFFSRDSSQPTKKAKTTSSSNGVQVQITSCLNWNKPPSETPEEEAVGEELV